MIKIVKYALIDVKENKIRVEDKKQEEYFNKGSNQESFEIIYLWQYILKILTRYF